jgi:division protein CdvB (Snf7/Vps24/ESCRT-III family)
MTDWPLDRQQTMTNALQHTITRQKLKTMTQEKTLHHQVNEQMTKFEKTMQELHLLKRVSKDLRNYRKMIKLKKYD